jgi:flagellin-like protein
MSVNKRKAQSEIITTVLIILLVLAAVVIVWQVVSNVIKSGETGILDQQQCIGLNLEVTSATATTGTCNYELILPPGFCDVDSGNPGIQTTLAGQKKGACPDLTSINCKITATPFTTVTLGSVTVTRKAGTAKVKEITPILFVNGGINGAVTFTPATLETLESGNAGVDLAKGDKVKVGAKLGDNLACGESAELTVA